MCHGGAKLSADPSWHTDHSVCLRSTPGREHISQEGDKEAMQEQQCSKQMTRHRSLIKDENSREQLSLGISLWQPLSQISKKILVYPLDLMSSC